jgi:Transcription factor WhiB
VNYSANWASAPGPGSWASEAQCKTYSGVADVFTDVYTAKDAAVAIAICSDCPVRLACLQYGKEINADGVWGGRLLQRGRAKPRVWRSVRKAEPLLLLTAHSQPISRKQPWR